MARLVHQNLQNSPSQPRQSIGNGKATLAALKAAVRGKGSKLEADFAMQCKVLQLPKPVREYSFHPTRRWRFDFVFPGMIAVELEGGTWSGGRHTRGKGFESDCHKYAEAVLLGWRVGRFTSGMVKDGAAIRWVEDMLRIYGK